MSPSPARRRVRRRLGPLVGVGIAALCVTACSHTTHQAAPASTVTPATAPPVALSIDRDSDSTSGSDATRLSPSIGVLVTTSSDAGQGADYLSSAEGAQTAAYRLGLGGTPVKLVVQTDDGTDPSAKKAMAKLVADHVSGIVVASSGPHLRGAIKAAAGAGVPVLMPYYRTIGKVPANAWQTGPSMAMVDQRLTQALAANGGTGTLVITGDGYRDPSVPHRASFAFTGANRSALSATIKREVKAGTVDDLLIAASAGTQAELVGIVQGAAPDLPVVLTPEALTPTFATQLDAADGTGNADLVTVGLDQDDATTLSSSTRGAAAASFFAALRLEAGDPKATDLFGAAFDRDGDAADIASHDAVIAIVDAVEKAGSTDPRAVASALAGLQLTSADGLAGTPLDFTDAVDAVDPDDVVLLQATTQDPGVRPTAAGASGTSSTSGTELFWFARPAREGQ